jgi:hypothetical protein
MDIQLNQNFARIIRELESQGMKTTKIAYAIGYTTTRQLINTLEGISLLSTKAVKGLIENLNVNPIYLFLAKGEMFLTSEEEIEKLKRENQEWIQRHNEAKKTVKALVEIINKLEKRNADLIDLSGAAIKFHTGHTQVEHSKEETEQQELLTFREELENQTRNHLLKDFYKYINEFVSSEKEESESLLKTKSNF